MADKTKIFTIKETDSPIEEFLYFIPDVKKLVKLHPKHSIQKLIEITRDKIEDPAESQHLGSPGPFQVIIDEEHPDPYRALVNKRRFNCNNYETCLSAAAALEWDSFTCRGCNGAMDKHLSWQAMQASKKDKVAEAISKDIIRSKS